MGLVLEIGNYLLNYLRYILILQFSANIGYWYYYLNTMAFQYTWINEEFTFCYTWFKHGQYIAYNLNDSYFTKILKYCLYRMYSI